jgi:hypothetical protein
MKAGERFAIGASLECGGLPPLYLDAVSLGPVSKAAASRRTPKQAQRIIIGALQ